MTNPTMAAQEKEQLPSYDALRAARDRPDLSPEMGRIFCTLDGALSEYV